MGPLANIKNRVKNLLADPSVSGRKQTTADYFISEVGRLYGKTAGRVGKFLAPETPEEAKKIGLIPLGKNLLTREGQTVFDPIALVGSLKAKTGRVLADLAAKESRVIFEQGLIRTEALKNTVKNLVGNLDEVVKVRKAGDGTIKITRAELEVMKQMGDLKPQIGERYFQNPIRVFEEMGQGAKELFYRPVKVAENIAIEAKNFWNKEFDTAIKGLDKKASERIMQYAVSQEAGGEKIVSKAPVLSEKENAVYEYIRTRYDALLDELNQARAIVGKDPINKVKNYFTHIRDLSVLEQMGFNPITDDIESLLANKIHRNTTAFQWAKKRTGALTDIEMDAFNVFRKYQEKAINHIKLTPAIAKVRELSRNVIPDTIEGMKNIPKELDSLSQEARKYKSAEEFTRAFQSEIKHGEYWHITDNPNFTISPKLGPRDLSSLASGKMEAGKLMVTSDIGYWNAEFPNRKFAAKLDFSNVKPEDYYQVNRGFGNEFFVKDPSKVRVEKVVPIEQALKESEQYQKVLEKNIRSKSQLTDIWNKAQGAGEQMVNKFKLQDTAPNAYKYITEWTDFVAGQKVQTQMPKVVENLVATLNKNQAFSVLSFNIRSALIQPSAIINTVTEIGPKNTGVGIKELLRGQSKFALENSKVLRGREFETAIKDMANTAYGKASRVKTAIAKAGIKPLQILDSITAQATWLGAYNDAVTRLGRVGEAAYNYADDIVTRTQASAARSDVAKIQRSSIGKIMTQFQTFIINDFNRIFRDVLGVGNKELNQTQVFKKAFTYVTAVTLWNYLSEDVLGIPSPFPRPIKALQKKDAALEAGKELASQVPVIGGALRFGGGITGAAPETIQKLVSKISGKNVTETWWELVGKIVGIPGVAQIKKTIKGITANKDGYTVTTNSGKKIKIYFTDTVDKVRALLVGPYETKKAKETRETNKNPSKRQFKLTPP